jgi:hypothetical protein
MNLFGMSVFDMSFAVVPSAHVHHCTCENLMITLISARKGGSTLTIRAALAPLGSLAARLCDSLLLCLSLSPSFPDFFAFRGPYLDS